ncbi:hypothetical protein [Endozoicomonas numazuensis]|uniref:Uncharacterized protein n=1 Tax=Endozoicomonas numazuensis TaxID=1137799 RepID=A0A081NE78_9GAMM|nr:hypothetical protein [Endozoicomonas numazuensis]KEQ16751.1 hypothetical protein GZ78_18855 [Endozoicomonas numazuensis]
MSNPRIGSGNQSAPGLPTSTVTTSPSSGQDSLGRSIGSLAETPATEGLHNEPLTHSQRQIKDRAVAYYKETGQVGRNILPSINDRPFSEYWEEVPGKVHRGVVDHKLMQVKQEAREEEESSSPKAEKKKEVWHVKTPGRETGAEKFKRLLQKVIYFITGKSYKAHFYDNRKVLAQRECLAAEAYKQAMGYGSEYIYRYSLDEERQDHCVASKDLQGYYSGDTFFQQTLFPSISQFTDDHNPATNLVMRRFLLGDQDYLKLDNYLFKQAEGGELSHVQEGEELLTGKLISIDFGMSFYNQFALPKRCTLEQFTNKLLQPSNLHRVQYRGQKTLLTMVGQMERDQVQRSIEVALNRIANLSDQQLGELAEHMHQPAIREGMFEILRFKRAQARALLNQESWPLEPGAGKGFSVL